MRKILLMLCALAPLAAPAQGSDKFGVGLSGATPAGKSNSPYGNGTVLDLSAHFKAGKTEEFRLRLNYFTLKSSGDLHDSIGQDLDSKATAIVMNADLLVPTGHLGSMVPYGVVGIGLGRVQVAYTAYTPFVMAQNPAQPGERTTQNNVALGLTGGFGLRFTQHLAAEVRYDWIGGGVGDLPLTPSSRPINFDPYHWTFGIQARF